MSLAPRCHLGRIALGSGAIAASAAAGAWLAAGGRPPDASPWLVGGLLVALAAAGCRVLLRAAGAPASLRALVARQDAQLREISHSQGRFVGNIAHEIKTPLTLVLTQLDLMLHATHDPTAVRVHAKSIAEDVRHLSDLVESFLRLARPFAQTDKSHHSPVDVHDFVMESVRRSQALAHVSGVGIVITFADHVEGAPSPEVLGDAVLLEAMVENLLRNAVRFSPRTAKVEVSVDTRGDAVQIHVRDHGTGIAAEHLESVFDWFFHPPGLTLPSAGTGFGLAIARHVAEHHGGTIGLRNAVDQGCEFEITLPRHQVPDTAEIGPIVA